MKKRNGQSIGGGGGLRGKGEQRAKILSNGGGVTGTGTEEKKYKNGKGMGSLPHGQKSVQGHGPNRVGKKGKTLAGNNPYRLHAKTRLLTCRGMPRVRSSKKGTSELREDINPFGPALGGGRSMENSLDIKERGETTVPQRRICALLTQGPD